MASSSAVILLAAPVWAHAAEAAAAAAPSGAQTETPDFGNRVQELVVVATSPVLAAAPTKASLAATQPQTIITRDAIDLFVPATADYTQIANLSPSVTGGVGQNGPGLSESKSTLRGFTDGNYNITYDGIPWGDANGPSHHSTSFFPASTIGAVVVDRGPGKAGDMGIASFGGSINLFSPEVDHKFGASETVTGGSFNTWQSVTKVQSGDIKQLNDARIFVNFQELVTDGYLTLNKAQENNQMFRAILPINNTWQLTLFGAYNFIKINTNDNAGATLAQAAVYGKNFSLNKDPKSPTYYGYNVVTKNTYFDYAKLNGDLTPNLKFETQPYVYYYKNDTESTVDPTLTPADIAAGVGSGWTPSPGAKAIANGDIPGYIKLNKYQIYGDITHVDWNFGMGDLHTGFWTEHANTHRFRYDYDATRGRNIADYRQKAGTAANGIVAPQNEEYDQNSGWDQVQPFVDLELRLTDKLTITPGFKYVDYTIRVDTQANQKTRTPLTAGKTFKKDLEYLTVNYKLRNNWSVYGQYATGILVPDISAFQVAGPTANVAAGPDLSSLTPQTSTNYQLGTVYHGSKWTADFDIYKIDFKNRISTLTVAAGSPLAGQVLYFNQGGVTYQGVEGQINYAVTNWLSVFANGSINDAKDNATHLQVAKAPKNTAAAGMLFKRGHWSASVVDKYVGEQWAQDGQPSLSHVPGYNQADVSLAFVWDRYKIEGQVQNIGGAQAVTDIKLVNKNNTASPYDQYYWQAPTNFEISLKAAF
jgi:iron complex outermembrane receptor protein